MVQRALYLFFLTGAVCGARAAAGSWPGFRGINRSGVGEDCTPPIKFGTNESVAWKVTVPFSPSSPCISGESVFITTFADGELQTRCYQKRDGKLLWTRGIKPAELEAYHRTESSPAASTPSTDGERVVTYYGSFGLVCYDFRGTELWRHPLPVALSLGNYGTAICPLIAGNLVIISRDRDDASSLLAVDLKTGDKAWETSRADSYGSFGSPILWQNKDRAEVVVPGSIKLKAYSLANGKEDWSYQGVTAFACTTPVVGDGVLFWAAWSDGKSDAPMPTWDKFLQEHDKNKDGIVSLDEFDEKSRDYYRGYDVNHDGKIDQGDWDRITAEVKKGENVAFAVKPGASGKLGASDLAWTATKGLPYVASPLFYQGRLYMVKDGGMVTCLDVTNGKAIYSQERIGAEGNYYASPVAADGRIYFASVNGKVTVIQAGGDKPVVLHQATFPERIHASPALSDNHLFLRTYTTLYAFGQ